jgi:MtN3 and saliva related transmembrane protein
MNIENIFGLIALITTFIGLLPQIYKTHQIKSTKDLSMLMLINGFVCSIAWIVYGITTNSNFVILSNVVYVASNVVLILQKIYYDRQA